MKKLLIGIGAVVVIAIAAVLVGPSFVDWNSYKTEIAAQVKKATGRDLTIDGDVSLSILPSPRLSAEGVHFANIEGGSAPDMASVEALQVRVAFMPLLQGSVQVESVTLVAPTILLEKLADGRANWELAPASEQPPAEPSAAGGESPNVSLDHLEIENGTLVYRDAAAGAEERIEAVRATVSASSLEGPFRASGEARVRGFPLAFEASTGTVAPAQAVPVSLSLTVPESEARAMFGGSVQAGPEGVSVNGKLRAEGPSFAKLLAVLAPGAALPATLADSFAVDGEVQYDAPLADLRQLTLRLGDTTATGGVTVDMTGPLFARAELKVNRLDLDQLLVGGAPAPDSAPAQTAPAAPAEPFTLPRDIGAELALTIDAVTYGGGVISNAQLGATLADGEIAITRASALLPGGSDVSLAGTIDAETGQPRFAGAVEASSDNLRSLLDWLKTPLPQGIASERLRTLSMTGRITATPSVVQVSDIDLRVDAARVTGGVAVAMPEPGVRLKPGFGIGLAVDKLNLDGYLGEGSAATEDPEAAPAEGETAHQAGGLPLHVLEPLAAFDANVELRVGSLTYNQQTVQGLHLDGTLQAGNLTLRDLSVQEFAGGKGALSGRVTDLAGAAQFDTTFDLATSDAGRALQFAGIDIPGRDRLGRLKLNGVLAGSRSDLTYDAAFSIGGIGAEGQARGRAEGLGAGIPRIDTDLSIKAKDAGPLLEIAGLAGAAEARLGALSVTGKATSGSDDLTYDLSLSLSGIGADGRLAGKITAISGDTPQVHTRLDLSAEKPAALLRLAGIDGATADKLGALGLEGTMSGGADAMRLDLDLTGLGGNAKAAGTVAATAAPATFDLAIEANHPELRQLLMAVVEDYRPSADTLGPFKLAAKATGSTNEAKLNGLVIDAAGGQLTGTLAYDGGAARPSVVAVLAGNTLDLGGFAAADQGGGSGGGSGGAAAGGRWSREPLDLSALQGFDADLDLTADALTFEDTRIDRPNLQLQLRDGTLTVNHLTGNLYGGSIDLTGQVASRGVPSASGKLLATNVDAAQLMGDGLLGNRITGPISVTADLKTLGVSMAELVQGLNGSGTLGGEITVLTQVEQQVGSALLDLLGGKVKEIRGITDTVSNVFGAFAGQSSKLTGDFVIADGVLETDNAQLENANARLLAQGEADLAGWTIDMLAKVFRLPEEAPYLTVDLDGVLDAPNARFAGGGLTGAVPPLNQGIGGVLQNVVPGLSGDGGTGETDGVGGVLRNVVPGLGGRSGQNPGADAPAQPEAAPAPAPETTPAPETAPVPQPEPEAVPGPPAPETAPAPEAAPEPEAQPEPTAEPAPAPAPEAQPAPDSDAAPTEPAPAEPAPAETAPAPEASAPETPPEAEAPPAPESDTAGEPAPPAEEPAPAPEGQEQPAPPEAAPGAAPQPELPPEVLEELQQQ
ncbi:MAG: hypothetical protein BroJett029_26080 [Alphaproteobacteria bacterium]|nr:MAG: hypothetical protein BroJett029_26080 [Alphaproteobacteria bacterium]